MVDIVGRETSVDTQNGKFDLTLDGNVVYLVGVSSKLEQLADSQPRSDLWVQGVEQRGERNSFRMRQPPVLDGRVTEVEWGNQDKIEISFSKVDAEDISGTGYVGWDENWLYVAVDAVDDVPMAKGELPDDYHWRKKLRNPTPHVLVDGLNVFVGAQPKYQIPSFLYAHDKHFVFAPKSEDGQPVAYEVDVSTSKLKDIPGVRFEYALTEKGWSAELAIPLSIFKDFPTESGATIAFEMSLIDFDPGEKIDPRVIRPKDANKNYYDDATLWNLLHLRE